MPLLLVNKIVICRLWMCGLTIIANARSWNNNLLLTEREGHTGEYWPEVVAVRREECRELGLEKDWH